ncbi:uncharacterized protein LTHEOB_12887 [Lasiodiplodia theobromae]|uniref:uncharacterized protein n=1 Tax=Lasiodiplodia theobromae TaxID=45133 RepID=UPI0015C38400|nr:uncharacterized protein LTHEOB_12887 [Lasiodiplodia theobromae]KAF4534670.1 hypothetical protein LTHEOB_12887 [Lasiodiplodia theobromae]
MEVIRPANATASNILTDLKSLSHTLEFTVFMKPSDYARAGSKCVSDHLQNDALNPLGLVLAAKVGASYVPLDWSRCELFGTGAVITRVHLEHSLALWTAQACTVDPAVYRHPRLYPALRAAPAC